MTQRLKALAACVVILGAVDLGAPLSGHAAGSAAPRAYHAMCARQPAACMYDRQAGRQPGITRPQQVTAAIWQQLMQVNSQVNRSIRPNRDAAAFGLGDVWTPHAASGDCEEYIIAKKHVLLGLGWSADQLLYAVVHRRGSGHHAVLLVRTDVGDVLLDNLTDAILLSEKSDYQIVTHQAVEDPYRWGRAAK